MHFYVNLNYGFFFWEMLDEVELDVLDRNGSVATGFNFSSVFFVFQFFG